MVFVIAPVTVRFPLMVRVDAAAFPYVMEAIVVGVVIVGWFVIAPVPSSTASALPGGVLGDPETMVQFVPVSHAVLVVPTHRTVPCPGANDVANTKPRRILFKRRRDVSMEVALTINE